MSWDSWRRFVTKTVSPEVPEPAATRLAVIVEAIKRKRVIRLGYARNSDGVVSLHDVAPIDVRPGDTTATASRLYLWAYCLAEQRLETHIFDRVITAQPTDREFSAHFVDSVWPANWPRPAKWEISRDW